MLHLKIRTLAGDAPKTSVSIPLRFVRIAAGLVPASAVAALREQGIDLDAIVRLSEDPEVRGTIATIEDHIKGETTIVSLE